MHRNRSFDRFRNYHPIAIRLSCAMAEKTALLLDTTVIVSAARLIEHTANNRTKLIRNLIGYVGQFYNCPFKMNNN